MGFQALFKFVKCWRAPDVVRETVPSSWGGDSERAIAEFQTSARDKQSAMSSAAESTGRVDYKIAVLCYKVVKLQQPSILLDYSRHTNSRVFWVIYVMWTPPFGTVFPHLYALLMVSVVLGLSSRLTCSRNICSRSAVCASDTFTGSFVRYKFVDYLLNYIADSLFLDKPCDAIAQVSRVIISDSAGFSGSFNPKMIDDNSSEFFYYMQNRNR